MLRHVEHVLRQCRLTVRSAASVCARITLRKWVYTVLSKKKRNIQLIEMAGEALF